MNFVDITPTSWELLYYNGSMKVLCEVFDNSRTTVSLSSNVVKYENRAKFIMVSSETGVSYTLEMDKKGFSDTLKPIYEALSASIKGLEICAV